MLLIRGRFFQVDKNVAIFFDLIILSFLYFSNLAASNETDTGTAGEQPVRDTFDVRRKCQIREGFQ
jgi:hypothetical protein